MPKPPRKRLQHPNLQKKRRPRLTLRLSRRSRPEKRSQTRLSPLLRRRLKKRSKRRRKDGEGSRMRRSPPPLPLRLPSRLLRLNKKTSERPAHLILRASLMRNGLPTCQVTCFMVISDLLTKMSTNMTLRKLMLMRTETTSRMLLQTTPKLMVMRTPLPMRTTQNPEDLVTKLRLPNLSLRSRKARASLTAISTRPT